VVQVPFRKTLPDGRVLVASPLPEEPDGRVFWECWIEGDASAVRLGCPLESTLADLVGYDVAHDELPDWIGLMAREIEAASGAEANRLRPSD
jgi:hypothetical protein